MGAWACGILAEMVVRVWVARIRALGCTERLG
jgi:hypothetical protein